MEHPAAQLSTSRTTTDAEFFTVCVSQVGFCNRLRLNGVQGGGASHSLENNSRVGSHIFGTHGRVELDALLEL
jgi:hypothetical protein